MELEEFISRLNKATKLLLEFAQSQVLNKLSKNVKCELKANVPATSYYLRDIELEMLAKLN
jgi:hypothetical protein